MRVRREYPKNAPVDQSNRTVLRSLWTIAGPEAGAVLKGPTGEISFVKKGTGITAGLAAPDESCATSHIVVSE